MIAQPGRGGEYSLCLALGADRAIRTIVGDTPAELAAAARGILGGHRVSVKFDADTLTGTVRSHGAAVGTFTPRWASSARRAPSSRTT